MATHSRWISRAMMAVGLAAPSAGFGAGPGAPPSPTIIGVNLSSPASYHRSRPFANLVLGSSWQSRAPEYKDKPLNDVDADGNLLHLPGGAPVYRILTNPNVGTPQADIRCTYQGRGQITVMGATNIRSGANFLTFHLDNRGDRPKPVTLRMDATDAADPVRAIDCRETNMSANARFDPQFLESLRGFKVLRFMDWQHTNDNVPVTWATRHKTSSLVITRDDGVAIEDMIALANQAKADAWFNMPWNADDDYIAHFARLVHDTISSDRTVYVELGNEVWNFRFAVAKQAMREGLAAGLSDDANVARARRYAQRMVQVMDIWAKIFADRPRKLVRVAAFQNVPNAPEQVLGYGTTADHIDMVATAPYFAQNFEKQPPANVEEAFARIGPAIDLTLDRAASARDIALKYGKRYGAYEAGQHIVLKDLELETQIQRDPRMYDAYRKYLEQWRARIGDTIMMFNSAQPGTKAGAWGMAEYVGQPLSEAPKLRAVREEIAR